MYEIYERYKTFRKIHFTWKKLGLSFGLALIISIGYLNYLLISDYNALRNHERDVEAQSSFALNDNTETGKITAENENIKVVWHYKILPSEYNNRGGGNIYELYDKRTDPGATKNLVGVNDYGGGGTHCLLTGMGGLGVTCVYDNYDENGIGRPATGDNGVYANLLSKESYIEGDKVFMNFIFRIKSNTLRDDNGNLLEDYLLTKRWTISSNTINYSLKAEMLRDARISEPRVSFNFKRDYWDNAAIHGHDMLYPYQDCQGPNTNGHDNPKNVTKAWGLDPPAEAWNLNDSSQNDRCYSSRHAEKLLLDGGKSDIILKIDNGGKGFEGGGMFNYGYSLWGRYDNHMSTEFVIGVCGRSGGSIPESILGAVDLHWFGWWGGGPATENRFKDVKAGDIFIDDTFKIDIIAPAVQPPPTSGSPTQTPEGTSSDGTVADGGQSTSQEGETSSESAASEEEVPKGIAGKVADSITNAFEAPMKAIEGMPLWQKQVLLAILLVLLVVEMVVIDKFTHVSKWLMYLYRHYIQRMY